MITIHMTTHRRLASGLLRQAINSVLAQEFRDFEFIICDDASEDGTASYLDMVAKIDRRVRILRNDRNVNSVAVSLGRCLQHSDNTRDWVSWMFDDCLLLPGALQTLVDALGGHPSARMLYGVTEVLQKDGDILRVGDTALASVRSGIATSSVLVPNAGILVHRDLFRNYGWYDASVIMRRSCDWDLFRRIVQGGAEVVALPDVLVREFGDLQPDSLRNAFTTTFELMARFAAARDAYGVRLDLENMLARPVDWIPPCAWSPEDLDLMRYMFLEYFLSVGEFARAFHWSRLLAETLSFDRMLLRDNLVRRATGPGTAEQRAIAAASFAGLVLGLWREQRSRG